MQWINLGDQSAACITVPDTCGPEGAAVSFWVKVIHCKDGDGIISAIQDGQAGFAVYCFDTQVG